MKKLGLYLHIPFCIRKCNYCDFISFSDCQQELQEKYVTQLLKEIAEAGEFKELEDDLIDSIFIGGGTPSLLRSEEITRLMEGIRDSFSVEPNAEITIECNPGTVDIDQFRAYRNAGINRISLGVQSTEDVLLERLGRIHNAKEARKSFENARIAGFSNINIDLMLGIPDQTPQMWFHTLEEVMSWNPEHLSFYSLQIEEGTPFYEEYKFGGMEIPAQEDRFMYHEGLSRMEEKGYLPYEISNAAKEGYACRHNLKYWSMQDYLSFGVAGHSFIDGVRMEHTEDLKEYLEGNYITKIHKNSREEDISDYLFTGFRKREGILLSDFSRRFGEAFEDRYAEELKAHFFRGNLEIQGDAVRFTERGLDETNLILEDFL